MTSTFELEDRYTLPTYAKLPISLVRGSGSFVWDEEGERYLDYYGGHCVTAIGHCPPRVVDAVRSQAGELLFYSNVVYNQTRAHTARSLVEMCPPHLEQVFFCNSGTEANEAALKLARKATGRSHVVAMHDAFHGRTLGSLAVTSSPKYRSQFEDLLPQVSFVPFGDATALADVLAESAVAAVILEPIQSMAGVTEADSDFYTTLANLTDQSGTVLIFDEVQTGVGRTGTFSISEQIGVQPDIVTLAKSLGSGIPVGAVVASRKIADTVASGDQGTTFGGGMIAMAAVHATLETIREESLMDRAPYIFNQIGQAALSNGAHIRGRGCLIGIDVGRDSSTIRNTLLEDGVIVGGSSDPNVMRVFPPLNTTDDELAYFAEMLAKAMSATKEVA